MDTKSKVMSREEVTKLCRTQSKENASNDLKTKLFIRADRKTDMRAIKKVVTAAADAGVKDVIFATHQTN